MPTQSEEQKSPSPTAEVRECGLFRAKMPCFPVTGFFLGSRNATQDTLQMNKAGF